MKKSKKWLFVPKILVQIVSTVIRALFPELFWCKINDVFRNFSVKYSPNFRFNPTAEVVIGTGRGVQNCTLSFYTVEWVRMMSNATFMIVGEFWRISAYGLIFKILIRKIPERAMDGATPPCQYSRPKLCDWAWQCGAWNENVPSGTVR